MSPAPFNPTDSKVATIPPLRFIRPAIQFHDLDKINSTLSSHERRSINKQRKVISSQRYNSRQDHNTVVSSKGFDIDANIVELIEALWVIGFETQFCCEGEPTCFDSSNALDNGQWGSHIVFPHMTHAVEFLEASYNHLMRSEFDFDWHSVMSLKPMLSTGSPAHVRAIVIFNPSALKTLTEFWRKLAD